jgi:predicted nucleic acid-binding protein
MTIIVDASIIISALINPSGKEAALIFDYAEKVDFVAPDLMYDEVFSKKNKIINSSHHTEISLKESIELITLNLSIFSIAKYDLNILKLAEQLTYSIDKKDTQYVALTILLEGLFWTGDLKLLRGLKRKGFNNIITTLNFQNILKGL